MSESYEIEPWMPTISSVGKGTPGMADVSVPRPYIPEGTGYKYLRKKPGFSKVYDTVANKTNIAEYFPFGDSRMPEVEYRKLDKSPDPLNIRKEKLPPPRALAEEVHNRKRMLGYYQKSKKLALVPYQNTWDDLNKEVRRHEFTHRMQPKSMDKQLLRPELDARIAENKSIRKGLDSTNNSYIDYVADKVKNAPRETIEDLQNSKKSLKKGRKAASALNLVNKGVQAIPTKPGMVTGRIPSLRGLSSGLVDMFMEGPEMQKAKSDPTYGMGEEERRNLELAYQYGL